MSLFGGDGSVPPYQSPYETESENPPASSPSSSPLPEIRNDADEQLAQITTYSPNTIIDEDDDLETETGSESEDNGQPTRPNRFIGKPQTWKGYTLADRQIATSLQQIEDADLAAHLYNAHALRRRVRRPMDRISHLRNWQSKDSWLKKGEELQSTDAFGEIQTELVPSMDWTAWPLPLGKTSLGTQPGKKAPYVNEGQSIIGSISQQDPGEDLREEILAVFLRLAKDKWNSREIGAEVHDDKDPDLSDESRSLAGSSQPPKSDVDMEDSDGSKVTNRVSQGESNYEDAHITGRKRGRKPQSQKTERPIFLADDMKARQILQPTINSMLAQLDDVATAIRRSRLNHFGRGADSDRSESEFTSDAESIAPGEMSASSSRRSTKGKSVSRPSSHHTLQRKKDFQQSNRPFLDSDSASDYGAEYDRKHRTASRQRKRSRSMSQEGESSAADRDWSNRVGGAVDWSEILGVAALKGWNSRAIARTAQRCSSLFGEGMSFMCFDQSTPLKTVPNPIHYIPSAIPNFEVPDIRGQPIQKRPLFDTGTLRCPHEDCWGNAKEFEKPYRVIEHCIRVHGYDPRTNDSDNEERSVGGVHVDGFLLPITAKKGWWGKGRAKSEGEKTPVHGGTMGKRRKKQKVEEPLENNDEGDDLAFELHN